MSEETPSPISAPKPPVANPISPAGGDAATLKLKPVLRRPPAGGAPALKIPAKPVVRAPSPQPEAPAAADVPKALDQLKSVTQKLKGVTQEIPQQAILRKTGIISDTAMTEAQKQAAKARTARISLSDAFGAAPVKESAPMKTIRIKRPGDISGSQPSKPAAAPVPPLAAPVSEPAAAAPEPAAATVTQRKTLKVARPAGSRPTMKFGVKKPGAPAVSKLAEASGGEGDVPDVADIPDMPASNVVSAFAPPPAAVAGEKDVPVAFGVVSLVVQAAACVAMGALGYLLYDNIQSSMF